MSTETDVVKLAEIQRDLAMTTLEAVKRGIRHQIVTAGAFDFAIGLVTAGARMAGRKDADIISAVMKMTEASIRGRLRAMDESAGPAPSP